MEEKRLHTYTVSDLNKIRDQYAKLHPATGKLDLQIARDYFEKGEKVKDLALLYGYHDYTIYNKLADIRNLIDTYEDYEYAVLPKSVSFDLSCLRLQSIKLIDMSFAKFQRTGQSLIKRADIVSRIPGLTCKSALCQCAYEMMNAYAFYDCQWNDLISLFCKEPFYCDVYESVDYVDSVLKFQFTESMTLILNSGRYIEPEYLDTD